MVMVMVMVMGDGKSPGGGLYIGGYHHVTYLEHCG